MVSALRNVWVALLVGCVVAAGTAGTAKAVDAPKWVAVLYVDGQKAVGLRWMPAPGATDYKVLRSETAGSGYAEIASTLQPQHFDKAVEPGSTYYYVLQAVAGADVSPNSAEKSVKIPGQKKVETLPPEFTKALAQSSTEFGKTVYKVGLFWGGVKNAIAYNLYRSTEPGKGYQLLISGAETQTVDTTVEEGKTYYYVVSALDNAFQETKYSQERTVVIKRQARRKRKKRIKLVVKGRVGTPLWSRTKDDAPDFKLWAPADVAVDSERGLVYASSNGTQSVFVLNTSNGELVRELGGKGEDPGQMLYPLGLGLGGDGTVYVVDRQKVTIEVYSAAGSFVKEIKLVLPAEPKITDKPLPMDVVVDDATGDIYVCDRGINRVWVLDENGEFIRFVGEPGPDVGQILVPLYMDWDPEGNLVVVNGNKTRIDTYSKDGKHLRSIGYRAPAIGSFIFIAGTAYDKEGNILVVDKAANNVQGLLPDGRYLYHLADTTGEKGAGLFSPKSIAIDDQNRLYVVEGLVNRIQAFQLGDKIPEPQQPPPEADE